MFNIVKLTQPSQEFISSLVSSQKSRSAAVALAVARVLAGKAVLPSSTVEDITTFYRTTCQLDIEAKVNQLNELIVIDAKLVMDYALKFYTLRYSHMVPTNSVMAFNKETAIEDFFGISRSFDKETLAIIKEDPQAMSTYVSKFASVIYELFSSAEEESSKL